MLEKAFIPKKTVPETFDFLVSFVPSDISVRYEIQRDKRIEIMCSEFHFAIHQFVERRLTIDAFILHTGRLNMTSKPCLLSHFKIIKCIVKSLIATSTYFFLKYN